MVFESERYTFAAIHETAIKAASMFYTTYGIRKGDRVGIVSRNYPEWLSAWWACQLLGAITVAVNAWLPMHPTSDGKEIPLLYCIKHTGCKLLVVDAERATALEPWIAKGTKKTGVKDVLVIRSQDAQRGGRGKKAGWKGMKKWEDALAAYKGPEKAWEKEPACGPDDDAAILFTSGT